MAAAVFTFFDAIDSFLVSKLGFGEKHNTLLLSRVDVGGYRQGFGRVGIEPLAPGNIGNFGIFVGQVPKGGDFFGV